MNRLVISVLLLILSTLACESNTEVIESNPYAKPSDTRVIEYKVQVEGIMEDVGEINREYSQFVLDSGELMLKGDIEVLETLLTQIKKSNGDMGKLQKEFVYIVPPQEFREYHLLMNSALVNFINATMSQITFFTTFKETGSRDSFIGDRSSRLLKAYNDEKVEAVYMYIDLTENK